MIPKEFSRIALLQVFFAAYAVLFAGAWAKLRSGLIPPDAFVFTVRDYGAWMLLIPAVWGLWAVIISNRADTNLQHHTRIVVVGGVLAAAIFLVASMATISATAFYKENPAVEQTTRPMISRRVPEFP